MGCFGSKAVNGLCQMLLGLQPPHDLYVETHLGGGALMKRKAPAERSIGIDRDRRAIDGFECGYPVELVHGCAHAFLAGFPFRGTELVYSDPPYLHATRRSDRRYRHDYAEADHYSATIWMRMRDNQDENLGVAAGRSVSAHWGDCKGFLPVPAGW